MESMDHILPLVEKPSRYIGGEINSVTKSGSGIELRLALAFPDTYEIGTSHFGMQILYHLLNSRSNIAAERVFAPGTDMARLLKSSGNPLFSLESRRPLSGFDIIGFSLLYELNYTNILMMLDLAGIPFYATDRDQSHPLVIAGGPCTVNPEPVAPFFDAMVVGDGESAVIEMAEAFINWRSGGGRDKTDLLKTWTGIEGVYVPSFFRAAFDSSGRQETVPLLAGYDRARRAAVSDLDEAFFPESPVVPFGRPVHDRLRLEIARGCTRGCRFCQAGMIYRPVRERSLSRLVKLAEKGLCSTGYEDISLLSLSTGDYSCLLPLMKDLSKPFGSRHTAISIPSFRAGTLSTEMMELIRSVRKTGFTIAPEAGSQRLRTVINKNITEAELAETMTSAFDLGWQLVKLYFMIGLPTETDSDVDEIVELVKRLRKTLPGKKRRGSINVSVATFIPKSHVPFQWVGQQGLKEARDKIEALRSRLSIKGVDFKWQNPETSVIEGVFARGDRRLARVLAAAYENGCRFDGWTDSFDYNSWQKSFFDAGLDPEDYLRPIPFNARLPWDHIDTGVSEDFLRREYEKGLEEKTTADCRLEDCQGCGVCDFQTLRPETADQKDAGCLGSEQKSAGDIRNQSSEAAPGNGRRLKVAYTKLGPARFFGQLELSNILIRALRRAGISLAYSKGFHPKPKVSFGDALPVGIESMEEFFIMTVNDPAGCGEVKNAINSQLPEGLAVTGCSPVSSKAGLPARQAETYRITLNGGWCFEDKPYHDFVKARSFTVVFINRKGAEVRIDLKSVLEEFQRERPDRLRIRLVRSSGAAIRPLEIIGSIFPLPDSAVRSARVLKLPEVRQNFHQSDIKEA
ncbi:MAG: TIGR03960 family B12-binding radical SAM protein [Desulfobacterales bacterium]|nr:TIGR03960 family B12-binding radical SAM protein [Desulfobacterales bacterium]